MFITGKFQLKDEVKQDIQSAINEINEAGGEIIGVQIESSTDTEPIKMGNEKLSQLRAESVQSVLEQLGVDVEIEITTLPDQGPDVYSSGMDSQERTRTRTETQQYRYVNISFIVVINVETPPDGKEGVKTIVKKHVSYELIKLGKVSKSHGTYKFNQKSGKTVKLKACKSKRKGKSLPCAIW